MSILDALDRIAGVVPRASPTPATLGDIPNIQLSDKPDHFEYRAGAAVRQSKDLTRVLALPRRTLNPDDPTFAAKWTKALRKDTMLCNCVARWGPRGCIKDLFSIQGVALEELHNTGGLLGSIGVGHGKTGIGILAPMATGLDTVLLIPPNLRRQFYERDFPQWSVHFHTPNLAGGRFFEPGKPSLHVIAYSELSSAKATDLLERLKPKLIIADEAHKLKNRKASRTMRFLRYVSGSSARFAGWSGTLTSRSLKDYAHLAAIALREGSPLPLHWSTVEEWAGAIDSTDFPSPPGALVAFGEPVREGFRKRLIETPGVVATAEGAIGTSLLMEERKAPPVPIEVATAIAHLNNTWERPDGELFYEALDVARCARELASGFYYRWIYPRGEPEPLRKEWKAVRKAWHQELREKLKRPRPHMDSMLLLCQAAARHLEGYDGPLPTWETDFYSEWLAIRDRVQPETEAVWISEFLVRDAAAWLKENIGIAWYEHTAFGEKLAELSGVPFYGPGTEPELLEKGDRAIIASIRAQGTGKNLQAFSNNLFANMPNDSAAWEQAIGRTHRNGQAADEVRVSVYQHVPAFRDALDRAKGYAEYVEQTTGSKQKLVYATYTF